MITPRSSSHVFAAATVLTLVAGCSARGPAPAAERPEAARLRRLIAAVDGGELEAAAREQIVAEVAALAAASPGAAMADIEALGLRLLDAGLSESAAVLLEAALEHRRRRGGEADEEAAELLSSLATAHLYRGDWETAFDLEAEGLAIRRRVLGDEDPAVARSLVQLAVVRWYQARFGEAAELVGEALAIVDRPSGDPVELAAALHTHGEILRDLNQFDAAEASLRRAVAIWEQIGEGGELFVDTLYGLVKVLRDRGQYVEADRWLARAHELLDADPHLPPDGRLIWDLNRAELLRLGGQLEDAEPLYLRQLDEARAYFGSDNPDLFYHLNQTAVFFVEAGRLDEAAVLYEEALALVESTVGTAHPMRAQVLEDMGTLERRRGHPAAAADAYRGSLADREAVFGERHVEVAITLTGLAEALAETAGSDQEALATVDRALEIFAETPLSPEVLARALALKARLLDRGGRRGEATAALARALTVVERLRSTAGTSDRSLAGFFSGYRELYHRMIAWRLEEGRPDLAFAALERSRGRAFLDQLAANEVDLLAGLPEELRRTLEGERREVASRLAEAQSRLAVAREDPAARRGEGAPSEAGVGELARRLQEIDARIRAESPVWRRLVTREGSPAGTAEVQAGLLARRRLLLAYQLGAEASFAFVVPPAGPLEVFPLILDRTAAELLDADPGPFTAPLLAAAVARALPWAAGPVRGLEQPAEAAAGADGLRHALWRVLVPPPLALRLRQAEEVLILPDGPLHRLPFEILVPELSAGGGAASYWLDDGPILRYGLSATVLINLERRGAEAAGGRVVMVADPRPAAGQGLIAGSLRRLPGTAREAEAIAEVLAAAGDAAPELRLLAGREARESSLRESLGHATRILHVATHGLVEEGGHELLAALALTPPATVTTPDDDGLLQLHEIYRLDLPAELAVLSACETSRGREVEGEGAFALSRGFLVAGARRVVASLWSVDDASTADLMAAFYRGLLGDGAPLTGRTAGALRDAKRELRRRPQTADPFYWAGFILTGSG